MVNKKTATTQQTLKILTKKKSGTTANWKTWMVGKRGRGVGGGVGRSIKRKKSTQTKKHLIAISEERDACAMWMWIQVNLNAVWMEDNCWWCTKTYHKKRSWYKKLCLLLVLTQFPPLKLNNSMAPVMITPLPTAPPPPSPPVTYSTQGHNYFDLTEALTKITPLLLVVVPLFL